MAKVAVPKIKLSNDYEVPQIGLGTWKSDPKEVVQAVKDAIDIGYRHFDCALVYENEAEVGRGVLEKIAEGVITREDLFITIKVWNTYHSRERVMEGVRRSLANLQTPYLDLCLIHWPMGYQEGDALFPKNDKDEFLYSDVDFTETWQGLEDCCKDGMVRSIGLSNFNSQQIQRVWDIAEVKPVMLQVECHPYFNQKKLINFCKEKNIAVTAYSCLGSPARPFANKGDPVVMEDPVIKDIAKKLQRSPAQICLRYQIERGVIVIPKSVHSDRLQSNFEIFDFKLSPDQMKAIDGLGKDIRMLSLNWVQSHPHYPFSVEY